MRRSLLIAVVSLGLGFLPAVALAAGKPISCGADLNNVKVEFFGPTSTYNIVSDGGGVGGVYTNTNGRGDKISLGFQISNCSFDFTMNLSQSRRVLRVLNAGLPSETTAWFFNFDRIGSVPVLDEGVFTTGWCVITDPRNSDGSFPGDPAKPRDNYAVCGDDGPAYDTMKGQYFALRRVGFSLADNYSLAFGSSPFEAPYLYGPNGLAAGTSFIKVYHPNANEWTLEPESPALSVLLKSPNSGPPTAVGDPIPMPFRMKITREQLVP